MNNWIVTIPPILVLVIAFTTQRVVLALVSGLLSAGLIATNFSSIDSIKIVLNQIVTTSEIMSVTSLSTFVKNSNLSIMLFLFLLGMFVVLLSHSGSAYEYANFVHKKISSKEKAQSYSFLLSLLLFVDDYFSTLTVGAVMRPIYDKFSIPRIKLAFNVFAFAMPLCILVPISSWVAAIVPQIRESGVFLGSNFVSSDTFLIYLQSIPFALYVIALPIAAIYISQRSISFGLMKKHEEIATQTGNLWGNKREKNSDDNENIKGKSILDFIFPTTLLITSVLLGLILCSSSSFALFMGSAFSLIVSLLFFIARDRIKLSDLRIITIEGFNLMWPSVLTLILAWSLVNLLRENLGTGAYIAQLVSDAIPLFLFPAMIFAISTLTALAMGTSWGTMAIMFPLAIPILVKLGASNLPVTANELPLIFPTIGAIISGAIVGNHISPISDSTIMGSSSTGADVVDHLYSKISYVSPIVFSCFIGFIVAGILTQKSMLLGITASLATSIILSFIFLEILN